MKRIDIIFNENLREVLNVILEYYFNFLYKVAMSKIYLMITFVESGV